MKGKHRWDATPRLLELIADTRKKHVRLIMHIDVAEAPNLIEVSRRRHIFPLAE